MLLMSLLCDSCQDVFLDHSTYAPPPLRFEAGTPAIGEAIGLGAAADYLANIGLNKVHAFETAIGCAQAAEDCWGCWVLSSEAVWRMHARHWGHWGPVPDLPGQIVTEARRSCMRLLIAQARGVMSLAITITKRCAGMSAHMHAVR